MRHTAAAVGLLLVLVVPRLAEACSCGQSGPPCEAAWQTEDIFLAEVLAIVDVKPSPQNAFGEARRIRVRVRETFRGAVAGEVDVWTGRGGGDCGYPFKTGEQYVVYAHRLRDGGLSTSICSRTAALARAGEDLAYLRALATLPAPPTGTLVGRAAWQEIGPNGRVPTPPPPYEGARIVVEGGGRRYTARTGPDGTYAIDAPAGTYTLRVEVPFGQYAIALSRLTLPHTRACAVGDIFVRWDGRILGRVVTADGDPLPFLGIDLISVQPGLSATSPRDSIRSNEHGIFEFERLPPGTYSIALTTSRADQGEPPAVAFRQPDGELRIIRVGAGTRTTVEDFRMPADLRTVRVSGRVAKEEGGVPALARIYVRDGNQRPFGAPLVTGRDGRFTLSLIAGQQYSLLVEGHDADGRFVSRGEGTPFLADRDLDGIELRLRPNR